MKSFPSNFTTQKTKKTGAAPFWILECPFTTGTIYLADYTVQFSSWKGGARTKPWVKNWGRITEDISNELALTRVSSFSLDVIIDPNVSPNMETILENAANNPETTDCRLYLAFRDLTGPLESTDPPQLMWRGNITDWRKIDELVLELEMNDISIRLDKYVGTKLSLDDYPDACLEDVGKVFPIVYGEKNVVTGLRSAWGARTTLASAITAASTTCEVTDGEDLPASGSIWIDDEKIGYSSLSKVEGTLQITYTCTGLTRGQSSTIAAAHSQGAQVWEYRSYYESILSDHTLKTVRAVYAQVGGDLLKVVSGISALVVNGRHVLRATQTFKTKPVTEITVTDSIAVSDPGHTHGVASTEKRYGTSASYSRAYSYFTFTPTTGGELNLYDGSDITSVKATYNGTSEDTATITVSFPAYNGPTPIAVYAIITHTSYKSTSGAPATATVKVGAQAIDMSNVKVTQRIPLGTTVPASITIQAAHPVYSTSYQVQTEVFEISMEVVTQATTSNPAAVSKSGTVTATGGVIQTRMVDRFVALVDGYAPTGTVIKRPDEIMGHFLQTYAGWNPDEFFSSLAEDTPVDCRTLGTRIGNMTGNGGLPAAFDGVASQPAGLSASVANTVGDTRTLGTPIGDMTEAGGLASAFNGVTEVAVLSAKKSFTPVDLRMVGTPVGNMTEGGGLAASFDNATSQAGASGSMKTIAAVNLTGLGTPIGTMTDLGGLAAAFDGVTSQGMGLSARSTALGAPWYLGKDWGVTRIIGGFTLYGPSDRYIYAGSYTIVLEGSNDNFSVDLNTLYTSGTITGNINGQVVTVTSGIVTNTAYRYHRLKLNAGGSSYVFVAELLFNEYVGPNTPAYVGKDWGSGTTRTVTAFSAYPSSDHGFLSTGGTIDVKLQGSTDNFNSVVDLYSAVNLPNTSVIIVNSSIITTTAYRYHRIMVCSHGSSAAGDILYVAEVQFTAGGTWNPAHVGKDWGSGNTKIVTDFVVQPPADAPFLSMSGTIDITLQGSNDAFASNIFDLYSGTGLARNAPIIVSSGITLTACRCHRIRMIPSSDTGTASYDLTISEVTLNCFADSSLAGCIGKDWAVAKKVTGFSIHPSTDQGFLSSGGTVDVTLEGSTDNFVSSIVSLYSATGLPNTAPITVTSGVTSSISYRCHRARIAPSVPPSTSFSIQVSEAVLNYVNPSPCAGYAFSAVIDSYARLKTWLAKMAWECRCYFRFTAGRAELLLRQDTLTPVKTITANMTAMENSFRTMTRTSRSRLEDIINKMEVHYHRDPLKSGNDSYRKSYKTSDLASIQKYGEKEKPELFNFDFVRDDAMAQSVVGFYLARYKDRKKLAELNVFLDNAEVEFADGVLMEELGDILFEVQQANIEPGSGRDMRNDRVHLVVKEY